MSSSTPGDVLVLAASNGENLKLAERFADEARKLGSSAEVLEISPCWICPSIAPRPKKMATRLIWRACKSG